MIFYLLPVLLLMYLLVGLIAAMYYHSVCNTCRGNKTMFAFTIIAWPIVWYAHQMEKS